MQFVIIIFTLINSIKISAEISSCGTGRYSIYSSPDDALCYWIKDPDDLPLFSEENVMKGSIFFIDASCKGGLNVREACSVEAAAKVNPSRKVNVLFAGPINENCLVSEPLASLHNYRNIRLMRIYVEDLANETGLVHSLKNSVINEGPYPNLYALDLLKFITLYKYGGIYMDLDIMATRPFDELPKSNNWLGLEDHEQKSLSTAIFAASLDTVGRKLAKAVIKILHSGMTSDEWSFENFNVLRMAVEQIYGHIPFETTKFGCSFTRKGLVLYASQFFFPIHCENSESYFDSKLSLEDLTKSFTQKLCNGMTWQDNITESSVYAKLMNKFCPKVYEFFAATGFNETERIPQVNNLNIENDLSNNIDKKMWKKYETYKKPNEAISNNDEI